MKCLDPRLSLLPVALARASEQRSHLLLVAVNPFDHKNEEFAVWLNKSCRPSVFAIAGIIAARHYRQHEVDITTGRHWLLPFRYLCIYSLAIDGGAKAGPIIEEISSLFGTGGFAQAPATWLYYPVSEVVGIVRPDAPYLTVAYANPKPGSTGFQEFYCTRHIRHALNIPALTSGQCFAKSEFQRPGVAEPVAEIVALYQQSGPPEDIIESFRSLPAGTIAFPDLDLSFGRFCESSYAALD